MQIAPIVFADVRTCCRQVYYIKLFHIRNARFQVGTIIHKLCIFHCIYRYEEPSKNGDAGKGVDGVHTQ